MDQAVRNKLRGVVTQCRRLLEDSVSQELQGKFGIYAAKKDDVQVDDAARMTNLDDEDRAARKDILDHFAHIKARGFKPKDALDQLIREAAFTHLNRFCAYKMMEARQVYIGDQKFRDAVSRGVNSNGVKFYLADHPDDERLFNTGHQEVAYRHFLDWLGGLLSDEIGVLFSPTDPANRLYPSQKVIDDVFAHINDEALADIWAQDETIGWVYQYFTPKELRDQARKESQAPRNSYELAFRNQFFTPRYVVEFLTDNTLGRIWYEMQRGKTKLKEQCRYMVRRPHEIFLGDPQLAAQRVLGNAEAGRHNLPATVEAAFRGDLTAALKEEVGTYKWCIGLAIPPDQYGKIIGQSGGHPTDSSFVSNVLDAINQRPNDPVLTDPIRIWAALSQLALTSSGGAYAVKPTQAIWDALKRAHEIGSKAELSQEETLNAPVFIPHRPKKDPRELRILDPASGSGHFLLYCFDLLLTIYQEAYDDPDLGPALKKDYPTLADLRKAIPGLILSRNLHGIDIDLRATQIAALALWLRCQRAYQDMGLKKDRPKITRSNFVCAEPMPGEQHMLEEFVSQLEPKLLGQLVEVVFDKMKLAGEAGSLLKIEEEIRDAVADARQQWVAGPISIQRSLFDDDKPVLRQQRFDFSGITNDQFFEQAEAKVIEALRRYADHAQNGQRLQRRLFTEDAVRGFAFVDICHKRFDVVLMNPPFGLPTARVFTLLKGSVPQAYTNIYAAFLMRSGDFCKEGIVGAISSRSFMMTPRLTGLRQDFLLDRLQLLVDLGLSVMDEAEVESCAYTLSASKPATSPIIACDLRMEDEKEHNIAMIGKGQSHRVIAASTSVLRGLPGSRIFYSLSPQIIRLFTSDSVFSPSVGTARCGGRTFDNFRFLRVHWEVAPHAIGTDATWVPFCKGGDYSPYYGAIPLLIKWENDGKEISEKNIEVNGQTAQARQASAYYFRKGGTYSRRSKSFGVRVMPAGCIFGEKGPAVFSEGQVPEAYIIGWLNTRLIRQLVEMQANKSQYDTGSVCRLPWRFPAGSSAIATFSGVTIDLVDLARAIYEWVEIDHSFAFCANANSLAELAHCRNHKVAAIGSQIDMLKGRWNEYVEALYGVSGSDVTVLEANLTGETEVDSDDSEPTESEDAELSRPEVTPDAATRLLLSVGIGVVYGRWDVRRIAGGTDGLQSSDPFLSLPARAPVGLPQTTPNAISSVSATYPLRIDRDGILSDDPDHSDDIIRRLRDVLEVIWKERADAIENEACEILGVKELRDYFRKPGKGGFWDDHVSRYSKSRRKAPIYWLLQSSKKNYAIWLYYHRLDKDLLFKALVNYVEPKIRLEASRLEALRTQKAAAGGSGKEAKRLAKEVERQEEFLSELRDFEDKLRRAASLHLEPDLNDGVVLNIAPLHELVPWKEAKNYWEELIEGNYEWSSIGKQLRQKGVVK